MGEKNVCIGMKAKNGYNEKGQTMVEYVLIIALIAIALIASIKLFGKNVHKSYKAASDKVEDTVGVSYYNSRQQADSTADAQVSPTGE
ncbi:MAG: Flp family type IVb pilin [Elusimicrobiota bacterium]